MKWVFGILVMLALSSTAQAAWHERWVERVEPVSVYIPGGFERCNQGAWHQKPGTLIQEQQRRWYKERYWVPEPPVIWHWEVYPPLLPCPQVIICP